MTRNRKWRGIVMAGAALGSGTAFVEACSTSEEGPGAQGNVADGGGDASRPDGASPTPAPTSTTPTPTPGDAGDSSDAVDAREDDAVDDAGLTATRLVTGADNTLLGVTDDGYVIYIDGSGHADAVPLAGGTPTLIVANAATGLVSRNTAFVWSAVEADAGGPSGVGTLTTWASGARVDRGVRSVAGIGAASADGTVAYLTNAFGAAAFLVLARPGDASAPVTVDSVFTANSSCLQNLAFFFDVGPNQRFVTQYCPGTSTSFHVLTTLKDGTSKLTFASRSVVGALTTGGGRIAFVQAGTEAGGILHIASPDVTGNDQKTDANDVVSAQFVAGASAVVYTRSPGRGVELVPVTATAGPSPAASVVSASAIGAGAASADGHFVLTYSSTAAATFRPLTNVVLSATSLGTGGGGRVLEADASSCTMCLTKEGNGHFLADKAHVAIVDPLDPTGKYGPMRVLPLAAGGAESVAASAVWEFRPLPVDAGARSSVGLLVQPTPGTYAPPSYRPTFDIAVRDVTGGLPARAVVVRATSYAQRSSQAELVYAVSSPVAVSGIYVTNVP